MVFTNARASSKINSGTASASEQLGGHTPRPRAPSDSLASVQVHESALGNAAVSLGLDGKRLTAPELQTLMREKFSRSNLPVETVVEADTVFEFAEKDAVRLREAPENIYALGIRLADSPIAL